MMIRGLAFAKKTTPFFGFYEEERTSITTSAHFGYSIAGAHRAAGSGDSLVW